MMTARKLAMVVLVVYDALMLVVLDSLGASWSLMVLVLVLTAVCCALAVRMFEWLLPEPDDAEAYVRFIQVTKGQLALYHFKWLGRRVRLKQSDSTLPASEERWGTIVELDLNPAAPFTIQLDGAVSTIALSPQEIEVTAHYAEQYRRLIDRRQ